MTWTPGAVRSPVACAPTVTIGSSTTASAADEMKRRYRIQSLEAFGFQREDRLLVQATGALLAYVAEIRAWRSGALAPTADHSSRDRHAPRRDDAP